MPSYSRGTRPRRCSSGTTSAMKASSIFGSSGGIRLKPSAAPSANQSCIRSATCSGVPAKVKWPRAPAIFDRSWRSVSPSRRTRPTISSVRLRAASTVDGSGKSSGLSGVSSGRCEKSCPPNRLDSRFRPISGSARSLSSCAIRSASASVAAMTGLSPGRMWIWSPGRPISAARDFRSA